MGKESRGPEQGQRDKSPFVAGGILDLDRDHTPSSLTPLSAREIVTLQRLNLTTFSPMLRLEVALGTVRDLLLRAFIRERETGTLFHFAPLFFGAGIAVYFTVPTEPFLPVLMATCMAASFGVWKMQHHGAIWLLFCSLALFFAGMSAAKIRTNLTNTHPLQSQVTANLSGTVVEVTQNRRGAPRYLIKTIAIEGIGGNQLPQFIRLSATSKHVAANPGDQIGGLARLRSFSGPAYPGGFDFSFNAWYNGLGGSGFFMGKPDIKRLENVKQNHPPGTRITIFVNQLRLKIAGRIRDALPGESGDVAVALIIGDKTGIDNATNVSLRRSGLAHVLAISGMHMALVSLTMVWFVRFLLALNMKLALTQPIKNWAAVAGFVTASSYLLISGMSLATQRAWIMISIMILAAIVARKSITLRAVAVAALAIMIVQPESILSPGFQMSFAAVAAIVAAYEWLDERKQKNFDKPRPNRIFRFFGTLMFTSLIAGLATSFFAAYHFHRVAPLGVLTNLMAMPLVSVIVMPTALLSVLAMPYGLEQMSLVTMGAGVRQVISISDFVNSLGSNGVTGNLGGPVLPLAFIGMFLLTMLKTFLRLSGAVLLLATVFFWKGAPLPDILLSQDGRAIAIRNAPDQLAMMYPRRNKFIRDIWLRAFSNDQQGKLVQRNNKGALTNAFTDICNKDICTATTLQGARVYVVYDPALLPEACNKADILLAPRLRWVNCYEGRPALIIKRGQLEEFGSHAIYLDALTNSEMASQLAKPNNAAPPTAKRKPVAQLQLENIVTIEIPETHGYERSDPTAEILDKSTPALTARPTYVQTPNPQRHFKIMKVTTAISTANRPWNRHRQGRVAYRQD